MKLIYANKGVQLVGLSKDNIIYLGWTGGLIRGEKSRYSRAKHLNSTHNFKQIPRHSINDVFNHPDTAYTCGKYGYNVQFSDINKKLKVGCCLFDQKTTQVIRRWAARKAK